MYEVIALSAFIVLLIILKKTDLFNRIQRSKYGAIFIGLMLVALIVYNVSSGKDNTYTHIKTGVLIVAFVAGIPTFLKKLK